METASWVERRDSGAADAPPSAGRLPGVVFTMRYGDDVGLVWRTVAQHRDLTARSLQGVARSILAYPELTGNPAYLPHWARPAQADFYDYSPANRPRLAEFIRRHRIAVVVFMAAPATTVDLDFLRGLGLRTINTENGSQPPGLTQPFVKRAAKMLVRRVLGRQLHDLHVAHSRGQCDFLRSFAQVPQRRLRLVAEGIDTGHFLPGDRAEACARLDLDPGTSWIMAAAQARPEKRVDQVIRAIDAARRRRPGLPVGFIFVGGGQMLADWRNLAAGLPNAADYRFVSAQSDLRPYYRAASLFVHGSLRETFGFVLAEAMASGLPVVATRTHGSADIVADGHTGRLVGTDDWDGFTAAVVDYLDHPDLRARHGQAGRHRCEQLFAIGRQAEAFAGLIRPLVPEGQAGKQRRGVARHPGANP